jgi:hypothetical protein
MTREAICPSCRRTVPSDPGLAFFEDRSPGTQDDYCVNCRYHRVAHDLPQPGARRNPHICDHFEPMLQGRETDLYYDGCRGWD